MAWAVESAMSEPEFDDEALNELRDDLEDEFDTFVASFLSALQQGVDSMRREAANADYGAVSETAHGLKGTAGYLGASALVSRLGELQRDARDTSAATSIQAQIDEIAALADRLRDHLARPKR